MKFNLIQKIRKIFRVVSEKTALPTNQSNMKVSDFGLIWRPFHEISKSRIFFKNPALPHFYLYSPLTSCKKSEKSLEPFLRKLHYQPTTQPNISVWFWANLEMFSRISPNQEFFSKSQPLLLYLYNTLTSCKKLEKYFDPFLRKLRYQPTNQPNINVSDFGPIWRCFHKNLQIKTFFQKSGSVTFLPL